MAAPGVRPKDGEWQRLRKRVLLRDGYACQRCQSKDQLQVDHITELADGGDNGLGNLVTLCAPCHRAKTQAARRQRAAAKAPNAGRSMAPPQLSARLPSVVSDSPKTVLEQGRPDTSTLSEEPREQAETDPDPLRFPPPHPEAVDSLGDHAARWIEERLGSDGDSRMERLRWWQWLVLQRLLERRADGSWAWPVSLVSVSRQQGKTELLCELAAWRAGNADLFDGRPQLVGHTANTVVLAKEVHGTRWRWAESQGLAVARQLGDTRITWPDGSRWQTMAKENTYGRSLNLVLGDEAWAWEAYDFWQALFPTLAARPDGQAVMFSTAHDDPKGLVGSLVASESAAVMAWGAPEGADVSDRAVWRAASPYYDAQRERVMELAAGQDSFASQWLNQWPESMGPARRWLPVELWSRARDALQVTPDRVAVAAVEKAGSAAGVGLAWRDGPLVRVTAVECDSLADAWVLAGRAQVVLCGADMVREPAARRLRALPVGSRHVSAALQAIRTMCEESTVAWDGDDLDAQLRRLEVVESDGLLSVGRKQRSHLVRVMAWAAAHVRQRNVEPLLHIG